jgi:hypothetical protein
MFLGGGSPEGDAGCRRDNPRTKSSSSGFFIRPIVITRLQSGRNGFRADARDAHLPIRLIRE